MSTPDDDGELCLERRRPDGWMDGWMAWHGQAARRGVRGRDDGSTNKCRQVHFPASGMMLAVVSDST